MPLSIWCFLPKSGGCHDGCFNKVNVIGAKAEREFLLEFSQKRLTVFVKKFRKCKVFFFLNLFTKQCRRLCLNINDVNVGAQNRVLCYVCSSFFLFVLFLNVLTYFQGNCFLVSDAHKNPR